MTEQPQPHTLKDLLDHAADTRGLSGRKLADLAQQHGFRLVHTTVNQIRSGTYKSRVSEENLRAIAWLAGVPERVAFEAVGRPLPGKPFAEELPPVVDQLGPRERKAAVAMLRALVAQQERIDELERGKDDDSNPGNPGLYLIDPADTLAAQRGRAQDDIESEKNDRWDGIDPPGPEDGV